MTVVERKLIFPEMRKVIVPEMRYGDAIIPAYDVGVGFGLVRDDRGYVLTGKTRDEATELLAERELQLPTMSLLWHLTNGGIHSPFLVDASARNQEKAHRWDQTATKLVKTGDDPYVVNVFEYLGGEWVLKAEDQRVPEARGSNGRKIVEANPITGLPTEAVDLSADGEHLGYWWYNERSPENNVWFGGKWGGVVKKVCFGVDARGSPSDATGYVGFRPVQIL